MTKSNFNYPPVWQCTFCGEENSWNNQTCRECGHSSLMKQAYASLEQGEWEQTQSFCNTILNNKHQDFGKNIAKELIKKVRELQADNLLNHARQNLDSGDCDSTIELCNQVLQIIPDNADAQDLIAKAQRMIAFQRMVNDALQALNSGIFNKCVGLCDTLIREQAGDFNISLPEFQGQCSQLRDQALLKNDELKQLIIDLEAAENKRDWPTVKSICQTILALCPINDSAKTKLLSADNELQKLSEAEEREKLRRIVVKTWKQRIIIGTALLLVFFAYKTWRYGQFAHLRSNFENAIATQDYTNALNIAQSITNKYKPAQDFVDYDKARKAFESVFAQADVDLLKRYDLNTWQTIISLKQRGETDMQFAVAEYEYETALLLLINLQQHASNIVYKAVD